MNTSGRKLTLVMSASRLSRKYSNTQVMDISMRSAVNSSHNILEQE